VTRTNRPPPGRRGRLPDQAAGFTLMEMTVVLVVLGILSAVIMYSTPSLDPAAGARFSELRSQIRYVQLRAMKSGTDYYGLKCDGATYYWAFNSTAPDTADARLVLPGASSTQVALADKGLTMTAFTLYFDTFGIPYSGATPTKLAAPLVINVAAGGVNATLSITPETGFVQ